jgi:predicted ester cyclase
MVAESHKLVLHRLVELKNTASPTLATQVISPSALFRIPGSAEQVLGPRGYLQMLEQVRAGFPDLQWTLDDMAGAAQEFRLAARFTIRGTHAGSVLGVPATGKAIAMPCLGFYRLTGTQIVEEFVEPDLAGLLRYVDPRRAPRRQAQREGRERRRDGLLVLKSFVRGGTRLS